MRLATGAPGWLGGLLVAVVVVFSVATGGMRSITFVQAFQYWLKLTALASRSCSWSLAWQADGSPTAGDGPPTFRERTTVEPHQGRAVRRTRAGDRPRRRGARRHDVRRAAGPARRGRRTGCAESARADLPRRRGRCRTRAKIEPADNELWSSPLSGSGGRDHPLYATYSLILALFFGTMGLPHVLVRFYTNPDGRAARRTTLVVLCLLGGFYLFPTIYGALARLYTPDLLLTGRTDAAVLLLPERLDRRDCR